MLFEMKAHRVKHRPCSQLFFKVPVSHAAKNLPREIEIAATSQNMTSKCKEV